MSQPKLAWCFDCEAWLPYDWFEPLAASCRIHEQGTDTLDEVEKAAQERGALGGQATKAKREGEPKK